MLTLLFTAQSCKKDDVQIKPQSNFVQVAITTVNGPTTGSVGQELAFNLGWDNLNINTRFDGIVDSVVNNTHHIRLYALTNVPDSVAVKPVLPMVYKFKADTAGVHYLKFYNSAASAKRAIVDTVVIK
ncbi:hypothetical protein GCM10028827_36820 [Mucilaginibacter myungsuensis]